MSGPAQCFRPLEKESSRFAADAQARPARVFWFGLLITWFVGISVILLTWTHTQSLIPGRNSELHQKLLPLRERLPGPEVQERFLADAAPLEKADLDYIRRAGTHFLAWSLVCSTTFLSVVIAFRTQMRKPAPPVVLTSSGQVYHPPPRQDSGFELPQACKWKAPPFPMGDPRRIPKTKSNWLWETAAVFALAGAMLVRVALESLKRPNAVPVSRLLAVAPFCVLFGMVVVWVLPLFLRKSGVVVKIDKKGIACGKNFYRWKFVSLAIWARGNNCWLLRFIGQRGAKTRWVGVPPEIRPQVDSIFQARNLPQAEQSLDLDLAGMAARAIMPKLMVSIMLSSFLAIAVMLLFAVGGLFLVVSTSPSSSGYESGIESLDRLFSSKSPARRVEAQWLNWKQDHADFLEAAGRREWLKMLPLFGFGLPAFGWIFYGLITRELREREKLSGLEPPLRLLTP